MDVILVHTKAFKPHPLPHQSVVFIEGIESHYTLRRHYFLPPSEASSDRPSGATMVTAAGTYATQSAFTAAAVKKEENM